MDHQLKKKIHAFNGKNKVMKNWNREKSLLWLFLIEGMLFQLVTAINNLGNSIYATNLGATDTQIGLIQTVPNVVGILLMLPVGMLATKSKSTKTMPILLLTIMGCSYLGYASVPALGKHVMFLYLLFLGINLGVMGVYNPQWQLFFGDTVEENNRNRIFSKRNQAMFLSGAIIPFFCGLLLSGLQDTSAKIIVLRSFFYLCSAALFLQAFLIWKIPKGNELAITSNKSDKPTIKLSALKESFFEVLHNKKLLLFFMMMLLFYISWELDWSMWYIGQVKYIGMTEAQLSYYNALVSLFQMASIGFYAKQIEKKGVMSTFLHAVLALAGFPFMMATAMLLPAGMVRVWSFMLVCVVISIPQGCVNLCLVQMVLKALPTQRKEIMMSLYSLMILFSNCILPLFGVRIYQWFGSNLRALLIFLSIEFILRICSYVVFRFVAKIRE